MRDAIPCPKWLRGSRQGRWILCRRCGWKKSEHPIRENKHHAKVVRYDGIRFGSQGEGMRYLQLKALAAVGEIRALEVHPTYDLWVDGTRVGRYTPDFRYCTRRGNPEWTVEEVKGVRTEAYRLRVALFRALYPTLEFIETAAKTLRPKRRRVKI